MRGVHVEAWVTYALSDSDVSKALTLGCSLKRVLTTRKLAVMVSPQISTGMKQVLHHGFDFVFFLQEDLNTAGLKEKDLAKVSALTLVSFEKLVLLPPTMMVMRNCDELFEGEMGESSWVENQDGSIVLAKPCLTTYNAIKEAAQEHNGSKQAFLRNRVGKLCETKAISFQIGKPVGNEKDLALVNLESISETELETNFGLIGKLAFKQWNDITNGYVLPLLEQQGRMSIAVSGIEGVAPVLDYKKEPIVVIGMACRYPGANNLEEFWNILVGGEEAVGNPPEFRWLQEQSSRPVSECKTINAGFLKCPVDEFDSKFFGISPKEMVFLDPQHRLLHELVWEGLEDAAVNPQELRGTDGGVFIGSWLNNYKDIVEQESNKEFYRTYMGNSIGAAAARISFLLGMTGPSIATESGCSSAMVAVHLACKSLQNRETSFALACGVNLLLQPFDKDEMPVVLSPEGRCKTFDAKADGFARAEGCGVLVLKRLSDAVRDGDKIWALIRGSGMTQEGVSKSMGTPTIHCESLAMKNALQDASVAPDRVSYVEAHGTGTVVGDPMEIAAIAKAYHSKLRKEPLLIGSVKTNVGHTESCSGITGIMKVVLAMQNEIIPPHRNFETLNPAIDLDAVPAEIPLKPVEWEKQQGIPRIAGVSSFGITGTDCHAIIEESPSLLPKTLSNSGTPERPFHILKISAKTDEALSILLERYQNHLRITEDSLKNLSYTANVGRSDFNQRAVIIAKSKEEAIRIIETKKLIKGEASPETLGKVCFLFTGQGSQYPGMAKQLYESSPVFRMHFEYCEKILTNNYNIDITQVLWSEAKSAEVSRTIYSQTSIFCVEYALLKLWESWGVKADYALGHSLGEFAAAVCAGILSVEDALMLVAERSRLIDQLPRGKMLVIKADMQKVDTIMKKFAIGDSNKILDYAAVNSAEQTVVAGDAEVVLHFGNFCKENNLKCIVLEATHAFHSKHMDPMLDEYRKIANTVKKFNGNDCSFISGMHGDVLKSVKVDAEYWVQHTREKVSFLEASMKAVSLGCKVFIEIGPQPILSALTTMNNDTPLMCLPSLKRNENEWETLLNTLGNLYVKGLEIDWKGLDQFCNRKKVTLPHYPFIGKKFWPDLVASTGTAIHPLLGSHISNASATKLFQSGLNLRALEYVKDHAIGDHVIFPGAGYLEMCLAAGLATVEGSNSSLAPPTRPMKVENLSIEAPLCLLESKTCQLQTVVELNENEGDWNDMKVSIFRRGESDSSKWLPHARATFSPIPTAEEKQIQFDFCQFQETLQLVSNEGELSQFYGKLASVGLKFGPTFRSIEKIWRSDSIPTTMLAKVKVPLNDGGNPYIIHPVVLDAMIQAMMMLRHASNIKKKLYVPIKIGKFIWLQELDPVKDIYIHVDNSSNASALLVDSSGVILAQMSSVELIDTTVKAIESVLEQQTISMPDMWEEVWRSQPGPLQYTVDLSSATNTASVEFTNLMETYNNLSPQLAETFSQVEKLTYLYFLKALYDCGWKPEPGQEFATVALQHRLGIQPAFRQYFGFILETLEIEATLEKRDENSWKLKSMPPSLPEVVAQLNSSLLRIELAKTFAPTLLLSKYGEKLGAILRGEGSALGILFPEENKGEMSVFDFYQDYGNFFLVKESASKSTNRQFAHIRSGMKGQRFIVKILEVGAGTGSYTQSFIQGLAAEGVEFEYTYTDISAAFFPAAQKKFEKYAKSMKFKKLNIEEDPISQGFASEYFDYVFVAEVIHATRDVRETLRNIRLLLKPFGKVDIIDQTRENRILTYLFGGLEGFWRFQDFDIRTRHCTLDPQRWEQVFRETGFKIDAVYPIVFGYHSCMNICKTEESQLSIMAKQMSVKRAWVLFDEAKCRISGFLKENIENSAARKVFLVRKGDCFQEAAGGLYEVRSSNEEDFHSLYSSIKTRGLEVEGIVYCWALHKETTSQDEILQPFFHLTKAAMELPGFNPRILAVTNGGVVPLEENDLSHFHSSLLWGFTKSLKNENVNINCSCVELIPDPGEKEGEINERRLRELFHEIWNWNSDVQVAYFGGSRHVPKLIAHKPLTHALTLPKGTDKFQLILPETKAIADLSFGPLELGNLKENEVEVQVKASALNFRDVLSVIKPSEEFKDINAVGFDFSGVIKRLGAKVRKWKVGDLVYGCNINLTALPSHVHAQQDLLIPLSGNMTLCEGATIPAVYMTSIVCLLDVAKIRKEDVVLIHTASGGVGLSAIEICNHVGCTIIATAGSKRKKNYLRSLGIRHIFHSRNTQFGDQILELTNGRGVDAVLNSLTSEGFKEATLKACAKGARFVEMSKLNIYTPEEVKGLRPDVEYTAIDLSQSDRLEWGRLIASVRSLKEQGVIKPIPYLRFDALHVREGLQFLQKAKHIGKIVCVMPELRQEEGKMKAHTPMFNDRSTYLITGGLGGIGFVVCKWMIDSGAKHVILASRRGPGDSTQAGINEMNSKGANIIPIQLDVGNFEECRNLIQVKIPEMGLPLLRGVMHAAGTLSDGIIVNQDWPKLSSTFHTKINGTINLHELTKNLNLEHFVMFSSMASILGPPAQCNHAAGNCFEDAITHYRNSMGLPATTVNWGQWGEVGVATEADLAGVKPLSNLHGTTGLEYVLKSHRAQTCILNVSSFVILSKLFPHLASYLDERIWKKSAVAGIRSVTIKSEEFWQQYDSAGDLEEKTESLKTQLKNILRNTLKLEENDVIGDDIDLQQIGVDSLMFVEIKNGLQTLLGDRLTVNASSLKDSNTVNLIVSTLVKLIEGTEDEGETVTAKPTMEEVSKLMREDAQLPEHIGAKPGQKAVSIPEIKSVLLTGCTGTFGPYILKQLAELPQITEVVCLIRPSKTISVDERLAKVLSGKHLLSKVDMGKVRCVAGNVAEPHLGMEPDVWNKLASTIDAIFHCAACVRHTQHYRKLNSQTDMRAVNIGGIKNILEFDCENKLKHIYNASTLLAVSTIDEECGRLSEKWPEIQDFENVTTFGYPVTKFVADVLIKQAVERGIPAKVFRLPLIVGESETGRCSVENNHLLLRYLFIMKCGKMPYNPIPLNTLPVDTCANVSVRLFFNENAPLGVYNISHAKPNVDQEFVGVATRFGKHVELVEFSEFSKLVMEAGDHSGFAMFKDFYTEDNAMVAYASTLVLKKWIEEGSDSESMWKSTKVEKLLPGFYEQCPNTIECVYRNLSFLKGQGWFNKFGLL